MTIFSPCIIRDQIRLGKHMERCSLWKDGMTGVVGVNKELQCLLEVDQAGHRVDVLVRGQCESMRSKVVDQLGQVRG